MKRFTLDRSMTTMRGVFYPTGHVVLMLPQQQDAEQASRALAHAGFSADDMSLMDPELIMGPIAETIGHSDILLPSAGTEADTVRRMMELAAEGHWGLVVHAPKAEESERVMKALRGLPVAYAQKYRQLVIEDLEPETRA